MTDRDRADTLALCDRFREAMARENDLLLYDHKAKQRIGEMIGSAARKGR
jgi:hypothetical protein